MNEIFRRKNITQKIYLLMPILFLLMEIMELFVAYSAIKRNGYDPQFLFSGPMIMLFFMVWILISLIPLLCYHFILKKQMVIIDDTGIKLINIKSAQEIKYSDIKAAHIYYRFRKIKMIVICGDDESILIGDFENREKIVSILEEKIGAEKIKNGI
jgi:hypothetical protein